MREATSATWIPIVACLPLPSPPTAKPKDSASSMSLVLALSMETVASDMQSSRASVPSSATGSSPHDSATG